MAVCIVWIPGSILLSCWRWRIAATAVSYRQNHFSEIPGAICCVVVVSGHLRCTAPGRSTRWGDRPNHLGHRLGAEVTPPRHGPLRLPLQPLRKFRAAFRGVQARGGRNTINCYDCNVIRTPRVIHFRLRPGITCLRRKLICIDSQEDGWIGQQFC